MVEEADAPTPEQAARDLVVFFSRLRQRMREVAADEALSPSQTSVLTRLVKGEARTTGALADLEGVRPQSMTATVAALEAQGLVRRQPDPRDGRRLLLELTDEGAARFADTRSARYAWLARLVEERLTPDERVRVSEALVLLERLTEVEQRAPRERA